MGPCNHTVEMHSKIFICAENDRNNTISTHFQSIKANGISLTHFYTMRLNLVVHSSSVCELTSFTVLQMTILLMK